MRSAILLLFALLPTLAFAQGTERFRLERSGNGFVRLDTQTGAMSTCLEADQQIVCRMAADEREALEQETNRLRDELVRLEARVSALESHPASALPTEQDIDKTLGVMKRLFRGFAGMVRELEEDSAKDDGNLLPNRT